MATTPPSSGPDQGDQPLSTELAGALERDEFFLVYQPTIDLQTNGFAGVEALIRWHRPGHGVVSPQLFIGELETSGTIVEVGRWALNVACDQGSAWHDRGYRFAVSVNIAARQFTSDDFVTDVAGALASSRFDPTLLVLEFAQSTILDGDEAALGRLRELKELGVRLSVDDFEPSTSTLERLQSLDIDVVKLDRRFISSLSQSTDAAKRVGDLVQAGRARHLQVIASGIENDEQRRLLQLEEVSVGQGYLFSVPHEAEEIDRFLEDFAIFSGRPL